MTLATSFSTHMIGALLFLSTRKLAHTSNGRGIRVVPEYDVPGHSFSWGVGYPNITANCPCKSFVLVVHMQLASSRILPAYAANVNNIPLNPAIDFTFDVVKGFFKEQIAIFPDKVFHVGGLSFSIVSSAHLQWI